MARPKRWRETKVQHGYSEVTLSSWNYFPDYVRQEMLDYRSYIWRGQRNAEWTLRTTLDRLIIRTNRSKLNRSSFRQSHLEQFQFAARGRRGPNPRVIEDEDEWWALGQHHGLATPLLDWTSSPFVAAYFAFIEVGKPQNDSRAVYALNAVGVQEKTKKLKREMEAQNRQKLKQLEDSRKAGLLARAMYEREIREEVRFIRPRSDENDRLVNQNGLFTRAPDGVDLDDWVTKNFENVGNEYHLIKILIPNTDRKEALRLLNRMNINHLTLFPDLYGASKFCNLHAEIASY